MPTTKDVMNHAPTTGVAALATAGEVVLEVALVAAVALVVRAVVDHVQVAAFVQEVRAVPEAKADGVISGGLLEVHGPVVQVALAALAAPLQVVTQEVSLGIRRAVASPIGGVRGVMLHPSHWFHLNWKCVPTQPALFRWPGRSS